MKAALEREAIGSAIQRGRAHEAVRVELRRLDQRTRPLAQAATLESYLRGARLVDGGLRRLDVDTPGPGFRFVGSHRRAAEAIATNLTTKLEDTVTLVGRRTDDVFRKVALEEVGAGVAKGGERAAVSSAIEQRLVREGVTDAATGFIDKAGKRWALDTYADMVARTSTRETMSAATKSRLLEVGHDLVTISDHGTETEICKPFEGETFSLTGDTPGYDVLETEPPFHPNCLHVMTPGSGDLDADLDALVAELGGVA